jgi:hypothetical protein
MLFRLAALMRFHVVTFLIGSLWVSSNLHAASHLDALKRAGENRAEIEAFLELSRSQYGDFGGRAAEFLVTYMPDKDLESLDSSFLVENLKFALKARAEMPWGEQVAEDLFFNDVLPYASLDESRERWRAALYEKAKGMVAGAKSISEAVQTLNRELFNDINVHYNTGRKRPNQSPQESIDQGRATCTGLSIILVDACRAVGIPARVTGTPLWTNNRGNHTWSEVWDGAWYFTGSDEYDAKGLNRGWFVGAASKADVTSAKYSIYSSSWKTADGPFPMVWNRGNQSVNAFNVTNRYADPSSKGATKNELLVRVRENEGGERIEVKAELLDELNQVLAGVVTKAGRADMNDIAALSCRSDTTMWLRLSKGNETKRIPINRSAQGAATLDLVWDSLPDSDSVQASQLAGVLAWLAVPESIRPERIPESALSGTLSKEDSKKAIQLLWGELVAKETEGRQKELISKSIKIGAHELKFEERVFGEEPERGHSLWISMHGGGGAPAEVNDRQWKNQIGLYEPEEGIYVAPRAPTDTWDLWHQAQVDDLFQRLIEDYVICRGVDPNRVYLMGYSAGGDGVYQLAPRMADRWAATAMMAGHPNETKPIGLRNIGFALFMGGDDAAYQRNEVAGEWKDQLASLRQSDPAGYRHLVKIYPKTGHWMNRQDREALPWMSSFERTPWPLRIEWLQDDVTHDRFYWLEVSKGNAAAGQRVSAQIEGQTIRIETKDLKAMTLRLSDKLVDLDRPISVLVNERSVYEGTVERSIRAISQSLAGRADPDAVATALVRLSW